MFFEVTLIYSDGGPEETSYCSEEELAVLTASWYGGGGAPSIVSRRISRITYLAKRNKLPAKAMSDNPFLH